MVEDHLSSTIYGNGSTSNAFDLHEVLAKNIYIIKSSIQIMHGCESEKLNYGVGL